MRELVPKRSAYAKDAPAAGRSLEGSSVAAKDCAATRLMSCRAVHPISVLDCRPHAPHI